jgi:rubrerythrin
MCLLDNLRIMEMEGISNFLEKEKEKWTCKKCGSFLCVHRETCQVCGNQSIPLLATYTS